jgi:non-canonical (house-cleaning) NTP pyrophosphatase
MKKVYVGSTNKNKVLAVKNVFEPNGFEVIGMEVDSGVSSQPKNDLETITGAENRAKQLPTDGIRIGLEAGIEMLNNELYLTNFGVLITEEGKVLRAGGTRLVLPDEIKKAIFEDGLELSDAMDKYFKIKNAKHNINRFKTRPKGVNLICRQVSERLRSLSLSKCQHERRRLYIISSHMGTPVVVYNLTK